MRCFYAQTREAFLADVDARTLVAKLVDAHEQTLGTPPGSAEVESWRNSLPALAAVLRAPAFEAKGVLVELLMPLNGRRCDAVVTGRDAGGGDSAVVVELKQWSNAAPAALREHVKAGDRVVLHPSVQVESYVRTLQHFHSAFTGRGAPFAVSGCAYLHNMTRGTAGGRHLLDAEVGGEALVTCPLFFADTQAALQTWLAARVAHGPGDAALARLRDGHPLPSPKLLERLVETVRGNHQWQLLDVQRTAYWAIRHSVQVARDTGEQRVVVVRGGPGTGKSVLAIQLLGHGAQQGWRVSHATGSKAFQVVLQAQTLAFSEALLKKLHNARRKRDLPVDQLFATFAGVAKVGADRDRVFDLVVCDEAHRLWAHRRLKYPNGTIKWLTETSMVEELIRASRVSAFFLDDNQSVRTGEIGRSEAIIAAAERLGIPCETYDLEDQYRCAGSTSYLNWVEHLFGHRALTDLEWREADHYDLRIWRSMPALDAHLRAERATGARVRLVAGYCWPWHAPDGNGTPPRDLTDPRFDGWSGAWIAKTGQFTRPLENQYYHWATEDAAYDEVGSIYSAQGFEFDHVGVIWGEDLVRRKDAWVAQLDKNKDATFKKDLRREGGDPVEKLLNIYRVLLTRGMRATHLFILDEETRDFVQAKLAEVAQRAVAVGETPAPPGPTLRLVPAGGPRLVEPTEQTAWRTCVPFVPLRAAASGFSPEQTSLSDPTSAVHWLTWPGAADLTRDMFAARVVGHSMEPFIPDGSICLFRAFAALQTHARPVLVRHAGAHDPETGGEFTVKRLYVHRDPDRTLHVQLRPDHQAFPRLDYHGESVASLSVIAEVVRVLGPL